jgi:bacterioferritin-associated ferredoxin
MIVCHCFGVSDREIRASVRGGAKTCADVAECCGAGSGCGGCKPLVAEIVHTERRQLAVVRSEAAVTA